MSMCDDRAFVTAPLASLGALALAALLLVPLPATGASLTGAEIELQVARLDTLRSLRDPLLRELAALGDGAIAAVVEKVTSSRRMTALGASGVLSHMASERALKPLLEKWVAAQTEPLRGQVADAIHMLLRRRSDHARVPHPGAVDREAELLVRAVLCDEGGLPGGCGFEQGERDAPSLLVYGEGLTDAYSLVCDRRAVQVLPTGDFRGSAYLVGRSFARIDIAVHDLPAGVTPMPRWTTARGPGPDRLAIVKIACGRIGPGEPTNEFGVLWVRSGGSWSRLLGLFEMTIH